MPRRTHELVGYIVTAPEPLRLVWFHDGPMAGVLMRGQSATLFATYARARRAVQRTLRYAQKHHLPWPKADAHRIVRVYHQALVAEPRRPTLVP